MRGVRADLADGYLRDLDACSIWPPTLVAESRLRKSIFQSMEKWQVRCPHDSVKGTMARQEDACYSPSHFMIGCHCATSCATSDGAMSNIDLPSNAAVT